MADDVARERDFFRGLVELAGHDEPEPLLRRALSLLVELSAAREAYLEIHGGDEADTARFWAAEGCDAERVDRIREEISRGIVGEALATGQLVVTASAIDDRRFKDFDSVREHGIEAVLCAPIGSAEPIGVVYLQGRRGLSEFEPFSETVQDRVALFARALAPIAESIVRRAQEERPEPIVHDGAFSGIVGRSEAVRELIARLRLVAPLDVHVLLTGPSGGGKTLFAHAIHAASQRRAQPFVEINCAAIPEALIENELFGADPGAHSAVPRGGIKGKVEAAEGGTLFLDEVAELATPSQAKLLQLLQDRTYYRLGSTTPRRADVRIVAATNVPLPQAVAERRFREDLFYRLKVLEARVPGLSERPEDLIPLAAHFCRTASARHGLAIARLSPAAIRAIRTASWPGNVRELAHRVESAVLHAHVRGSEQVEVRDLFPEPGDPRGEAGPVTLQEATRRFQREHVRAALDAADWNVAQAARDLDVARSYLYTLVRAFDLRRSR